MERAADSKPKKMCSRPSFTTCGPQDPCQVIQQLWSLLPTCKVREVSSTPAQVHAGSKARSSQERLGTEEQALVATPAVMTSALSVAIPDGCCGAAPMFVGPVTGASLATSQNHCALLLGT